MAGDQFAGVALTVLVFDRTESAGLAALTFLRDLLGGLLLSGLADRYRGAGRWWPAMSAVLGWSRAMAVPGMSLRLVSALLVVMQLLGSPFAAARAAIQHQVELDD